MFNQKYIIILIAFVVNINAEIINEENYYNQLISPMLASVGVKLKV